ncbi:MAG: hypothetical protein JW981_04295 [Anaerolineae bacterium]|nr:hypothetical protein [Anaerolineae bacterium]
MTHSKLSIRIRGLVSLSNRVRRQIAGGIPVAEREAFRHMVLDAVAQVEGICRQHKATPYDLPTPSRRAYKYLKSIDLSQLPTPAITESVVRPQLRIKGLVANGTYIQNELFDLVTKNKIHWTADDPHMIDIRHQICAYTDAVESLCEEQGGSPVDLPKRSMHAYQWLAFLSDLDNLAAHLNTLSYALKTLRTNPCRKTIKTPERDFPIHIEFYAISFLYRSQAKNGQIHIVASEGFIGAPKSVLDALLCASLRSPDPAYQQQVKAYAMTDAFSDLIMALEMTTADLSFETRGHHYDLVEVFERVNNKYFEGSLSCPRLTWNKTLTHRRMGYYQPSNDTLLISITLDNKKVPDYVIDFVMYHELLHKKLGVKLVNGRRYAHTSAFRAAEREFPHYEAAQAFLRKLPV